MNQEQKQQNDTCKTYKYLSNEKLNDIKQTIEELKFFKEMYGKELLTKHDATQTFEIINNLEELYEREKKEYNRLKAISISGIIT